MPYDYINFSCTLSNNPGIYADLTACENAVEDGTVKSVLILTPLWSATKKASLPLLTNKLGDGYQQIVFKSFNQINEEWSITSPVLFETQVDQLLNQLRQLSSTSFLWSPNNGVIDYQEFTCSEWQKIRLGVNKCQVTTTFKLTNPITTSPSPSVATVFLAGRTLFGSLIN
jgi:phage-related protein